MPAIITSLGSNIPTKEDQRRNYCLAEALEISRDFGTEILREIYKLGCKLKTQGQSLGKDLKSPETLELLAENCPNLIISVGRSEGIVTSEIQAVEPGLTTLKNPQNLRNFAVQLSQLSTSEFKELCVQADKLFPEANCKKKLWEVVDKNLYSVFERLQRNAYSERMRLQPFKAKSSPGDSSKNAVIAKIMSYKLMQMMLEIGADALVYLREYGKSLINSDISLGVSASGFTNQAILGLNANQQAVLMPSSTIGKLASFFHSAWLNAASKVPGHTSASISSISSISSTLGKNHSANPNISANNCDRLNVFMLAKALSQMQEADFALLKSLAAPGNPKDLNLRFSVQGESKAVAESRNVRSPWHQAEFRTNPLRELRFERPELQAEIDKHVKNLQMKWAEEEEQRLSAIFAQITDKKLSHDDYISVNRYYRNIKEIERKALTEYSLALATNDPKLYEEHFNRYTVERELLLSRIDSRCQNKATPGVGLKLLTADELEKYYEEIQDLIAPHLQNDQNGTLFNREYSKADLLGILEKGGSILTFQDNFKIKGLFIYYPQTYDEHLRISKTAYAQLILTTEDRPSGTYAALIKGMRLDLQRREMDHCYGFCWEKNTRSLEALIHHGHTPLYRLAQITESGQRFIPTIFRVFIE